MLAPWKRSYEQHIKHIRQHIKKQRHWQQSPSSQSYGFPVVIYGCESWTIKKAECQRTDAFELWCWRRLLRAPWTARSSNQYPKWNQSRIFIERTDVEAETPLLWPPDVENWLIGKGLDSWKDWRARRRGWQRMRWLDLTDSPTWWTWVWACSGSGDGQGRLVCCSPWGHRESETTKRLNWTDVAILCTIFLTFL